MKPLKKRRAIFDIAKGKTRARGRAYAKTDLARDVLAPALATRMPPALAEFRFDNVRKWRFDLAWPEARLAVEVHGRGRHQSDAGFLSDVQKMRAAALAGWCVLAFTGTEIRNDLDAATEIIRRIFWRRMGGVGT